MELMQGDKASLEISKDEIKRNKILISNGEQSLINVWQLKDVSLLTAKIET